MFVFYAYLNFRRTVCNQGQVQYFFNTENLFRLVPWTHGHFESQVLGFWQRARNPYLFNLNLIF